jgi:hypothetical protein
MIMDLKYRQYFALLHLALMYQFAETTKLPLLLKLPATLRIFVPAFRIELARHRQIPTHAH